MDALPAKAVARLQGKVFLGVTVPLRVGRLRLRADPVAGRVDRHVADHLAGEAAVLDQVAVLLLGIQNAVID